MIKNSLIGLFSGTIFGLGLAVSEMINPARVIGFLDITGNWDPTLAIVMASALCVTLVTFPLILKRRKPICEEAFSVPAKNPIDSKLLAGAALFGMGWGLAGLCPGPAIAALVTLSGSVIAFVAAMILGYIGVSVLEARRH
jgi:uncharacterized membrane protein YedE/YeeE